MASWPPLKNFAFNLYVTIRDADGDPITTGTLSSVISLDGASAVAGPTPTFITSGEGQIEVALTSGNMNADAIIVHIKSDAAGAKTAQATLYTVARQIDDLAFPVVSGRGIDVLATGEVGLDLGNVTGVLGNANVGWIDGNNRTDVGQFLGNAVVISTGLPDVNVAAQDNIDFGATQKLSLNIEADNAIETYHLDHLLAVTYDPAVKPGAADALLNELVESDAGVSRFTANALEQIWTVGTRILTAATNITSTGGTTFTQTGDSFLRIGVAGVSLSDLGGMSTAMQAEVNTQADLAITTYGLDNLVFKAAVAVEIADDSIIAQMVADDATADWDTFDNTTDSLEAIRIQGDAAWTTGGGSGLTALASGTAVAGTASTIDLADAETFADNELNGNVINIHAGTGAGQSRVIKSNTLANDRCTVVPNWTTTPSSDSQYEIVQGSVNLDMILLDEQSVADLKDFADAGYDPGTSKVQGVVLVDTTAVNTDVRGTDNAALASVVGTLADAAAADEVTSADTLVAYTKQLINILVGAPGIVTLKAAAAPASGVSLSEMIRSIYDDTNSLDATKIPDTLSLANINTQVDTAIVTYGLDHLVFTSVIGADIADDSIIAFLVSKEVVADWDDFDNTTDSLQAIRDRGDTDWITGAGGTGLSSLASGTARAGGTSTTILLATAETFLDDELNGNVINILTGTGAGQSRVITLNVASSDTVTVFPALITNPDATSTYEIVQGSSNLAAISLDGSSADNLELDYDGTGYAKANSTIGTVTANTDLVSATDVWAAGTRVLTAATNITSTGGTTFTQTGDAFLRIGVAGASLTDLGGMSTGMLAEVQSAVEDALVARNIIMLTTTINTLASQTSFTLVAGSTDADTYTNCMIVITDASTATQKAIGFIDAYDITTRTVTLLTDPGIFVMATGDFVDIIPLSAEQLFALATGAITAATFAGGAIDSAALNTTAVNEIRDSILSDSTPFAGANIAELDASNLPADIDSIVNVTVIFSGVADSGSTTTLVDAALTEGDTDYWKGNSVKFTDGTIVGQTRLITGFNFTTNTLTFAPATTQAVATHTYEIIPGTRSDVNSWLGTAVATPTVGGVPEVDLTHMEGVTQSVTDLKDFADAGYDPGSNKITGCVLTDTVTTLNGHTVQTGDSFARIGAAGVSLTDLGGMSTSMKAEINVEAKDVLFTDTIAELTQGVPATTPTIATAIMLPYMGLRNRHDVDETSGFREIYDNAGVVITKKAQTDDGSIYSEALMETGP